MWSAEGGVLRKEGFGFGEQGAGFGVQGLWGGGEVGD